VYNTQLEVINREIENVILLYKQYSAAIRLIKALGGGYYEPNVPLQLNECTD
jgi:outer membrane protein TolC